MLKNRIRKCILGLSAIILIWIVSGISIACAEQAIDNKDVLVKIGKEIITREDLELRIRGMNPEMQKKYSSDQQKKEYLDQLVRAKLLVLEAKAAGIDREKSFSLLLQDMNNRVLANEYLQKKLLPGEIVITDKEIEAYYNAHKEDFKKPARVRVQHILVKVPPETKKEEDINSYVVKIQHIKSELDGGADFKTLAAKYSDDAASKEKGGELGYITRKQVAPEFADAAFSLKKNEVSNPVKTSFGYHLIKVTDMMEESYKSLKETQSHIDTILKNKQKTDITERELTRLEKKYGVTYKK